jgi:hypothetical protein
MLFLSYSSLVHSISPLECSELFWSWVDTLAKPVELEGWKKYAGDMRAPGRLHFDEWMDIQGSVR